jgi:ribosome biogenesis GTPase
MLNGVIVKGVGGIYEVETEQGRLQCSLRGKLRLSVERVLVGDRVEVSLGSGGGVVEKILPRINELVRPPVANIDQVLVVCAVRQPSPNLVLLTASWFRPNSWALPVWLCSTRPTWTAGAQKSCGRSILRYHIQPW